MYIFFLIYAPPKMSWRTPGLNTTVLHYSAALAAVVTMLR
jgi:hypothetical protein